MENKQFNFKLLTSLDKIFLDGENKRLCENKNFNMLKDEVFSYQIGYSTTSEDSAIRVLKVDVISPIKDLIRVRKVESVPSTYPCHLYDIDNNYLRITPGLYPDILRDLEDIDIRVISSQDCSLWIDITTNKDTKAGIYPIEVVFREGENIVGSVKTEITIHDVILPEQTLMRTEWFHGDCLADYYNVPVFSEKHWDILENFVKCAGERGCNMLLTPVVTPSLDTMHGYERTTVQLVDVIKTKGKYSFRYHNLRRWIDMAFSSGMKYIEVCHLFSQWGAYQSPKVMAKVDGEYKQIFGWETGSLDDDYQEFLSEFIPSLCNEFKKLGIQDKVFFHISDEATDGQFDHYTKVKNSIVKYLDGFKLIDTMEKYEIYLKSGMEYPVVATNRIEPFLDKDIKNLWAYYCTSQGNRESNRFMAMPSSRTRIIATQLYKYDIKGFLHWGFNFYNFQYSLSRINPFAVTDAGGSFPSGDPFMVYPKDDGTPIESLRLMVFNEAMQDLRAFELLESLSSKEYVMSIIEDGVDEPITFSVYPKDDDYMLNLREKVNNEIVRLTNEK